MLGREGDSQVPYNYSKQNLKKTYLFPRFQSVRPSTDCCWYNDINDDDNDDDDNDDDDNDDDNDVDDNDNVDNDDDS